MCKNLGPVEDNRYHIDLIKAIKEFADTNDVFIYTQFEDVVDVVCRK